MRARRRSRQAVDAARELLLENTAQEPRRRNRDAQAARARERAARDREAAARRREQERRDHEAVARAARDKAAAAHEREQERRDREAAEEAAAARSREAAAEAWSCKAAAARAREDERLEREASAAARERESREREAAAARALEQEQHDREAATARAAAAAAPVPEEKEEEPLGREESKSDDPPAAPEGYEIVARVLEHLGESHLLPIFEAEEINDNVLPVLDPTDLIGLGVSQMTCLTMLGAAYSAAKTKKLVTDNVLDNVAKHQLVLEEEQREHRAEVARLRIRELPSDLCCPIMVEIMKDPVICVGDGHTYERCAITQWFSTGSEISPMTNQPLETTQLVPNHMAKKLIHALLEEHPAGALKN